VNFRAPTKAFLPARVGLLADGDPVSTVKISLAECVSMELTGHAGAIVVAPGFAKPLPRQRQSPIRRLPNERGASFVEGFRKSRRIWNIRIMPDYALSSR